MTWVDLVILAVLAISALLAFVRGFVREVLGIIAWLGAAALAVWANPRILPRFEIWLHAYPGFAQPVALGVVFLAALIVLLVISHVISRAVRRSPLGGLDRSLGLIFGLVRGAALVVIAYILVGMVVPPVEWPQPVLQARSLSFAYSGATWTRGLLPVGFRPKVPAPPAGPSIKEDAVLRATPQGRATSKPPAHE
jgi:membrane protein required for colicin V production